jgi:ferredoxin
METDIVIKTGADVWLEAFPDEYRVIYGEEAVRIIKDCAEQGLFHMVFLHCLLGGAVNEYVICNCCTDGCVPYILNRSLGQPVFPLIRGEWRPEVDPTLCRGCGECVAACPFAARILRDGVSEVFDCFGCGLYAAGYQTSASAMVRRKS